MMTIYNYLKNTLHFYCNKHYTTKDLSKDKNGKDKK